MLQANAVRLSLSVLTLSAILLSYPARAELEVISSTVAGLKDGTKLPDDATLDVGKGEVLRVMKSGTTYEIAGPYHGTIDEFTKRCPGWKVMLGACDKRPVEDLGATPGATRGIIIP
jgi:hypothetical protein